MLLVWLGLAIHACGAMSVTYDETWHWPVGVRNLAQGDFAEDRLNPPLARMWAAIPGAVGRVDVAPGTADHPIGERFVAEHPDFFRWYRLGRWFNLVWAIATAGLVYAVLLARRGQAAANWGLLALLCIPDLIAHASVVTPDSAAMACFFATSVASALWLSTPTWKRCGVLGVALGAMQTVKYTGVVFFPVIGLLASWQMISGNAAWSLSGWKRGIAQLLAIGAICLLVIATAYRFQGLWEPWGSYAFQSADLRTVQELTSGLKSLPVPLPKDLLLGIDAQRAIMEGAHPTFLNGEWSLSGFRSYFFWATVYKLPLVVLGLSLAGGWIVLRDRSIPWSDCLAVGLPIGVLVTIASFSSMQLGFRYIMPVLPVMACLCGVAMSGLDRCGRKLRLGMSSIVVLGLVSVWRFHPHHLSYFNELAGGPAGGRYHLVDSNIDWGQDLLRAKAVVDRFPGEPFRMAYFGQVNPQLVGIDSDIPPSRRLEPGLYLVSVNYVMGRPGTVRDRQGAVRPVDINEFAYFQLLEPTEHVGYSIDFYRVTPDAIEQAMRNADAMRPGSGR